MGHLTTRSYLGLRRRIDQGVPGLAHSEPIYEILKLLFTEEEARLCSIMPLKPSSIEQIAKIWAKSEEETASILKELGEKGLVTEFIAFGEGRYMLNQPVFGFFEFSLMRLGDDRFDRKLLSELFHKYINVENDFAKQLLSVDPQLSRTFVQEDTLADHTSEVLSYERASHVIESARCITVGTCFCRHKMQHLGMACDNPQQVCLSFNAMAKHLARHGIARKIDKSKAQEILDQCVKRGLVQIGENAKNRLSVICNCCGCCCDLLLAYKKLGISHAINPSNYVSQVQRGDCDDCSDCVQRCPVDAISVVDGQPVVKEETCLGCGVCVRFCPTGARTMVARAERPFVPEERAERLMLQFAQGGKTGNLLFPSYRSRTQSILRKIVNGIVRLPPVRKLLVNPKNNSRLLDYLSGM